MRKYVFACGLVLSTLAPVPVSAGNILISGFNADVVRENAPGNFAHRFAGAGWILIENGYFFGRGLPTSAFFLSATGSGAIYQLGSYMGLNALSMGYDNVNTGWLTVQGGEHKALNILVGSRILLH